MSFRARLLLGFVAVALLPLVAFTFAVRRDVADRLTAQYERRVTSLVGIIAQDLADQSAAIAARLANLELALLDDNRFRLAAIGGLPTERPYLLDYAGRAMRLSGLSMLQIQDDRGRIISSGHFRNEYDRLEPELPRLLAAAPGGAALVQARTAEAPFLALARSDSLSLAGRRLTLVGGIAVDERFLERLARDEALTVSLRYPSAASPLSSGELGGENAASGTQRAGELTGAVGGAGDGGVGELSLPFVDSENGALATASLLVTHDLSELEALRRRVDRLFFIGLAVTALFAIALGSWSAHRISRPLAELARKTARVDLDRLDIDFQTRRKDEIGDLSRLLGGMTQRLRSSASHLKEAERRATLGELARQVNHDIKNGLTPIRNVIRHLTQVAGERPERLPDVYAERQGTLDSSISYLEKLASNYSRLAPRIELAACDVNQLVERVVVNARGRNGAELRTILSEARPLVMADSLILRRILENLVDNAIDSLESRPGTVTVSTQVDARESGEPVVQVVVADSGRGMSEDEVRRAFDDFYTTKEGGTGLGLSIVRRLVMDLSGTVRVESAPGKGSRFLVELPGVRHGSGVDLGEREGGVAET